MIQLPYPKLLFVRLDGVEYAAHEASEFLNKIRMDEIISTAAFHHLEDSELLREANKLAKQILSQLPPEQAAMFRAVPDQPCFGTMKIADPRAPEVHIKFED